LFGSLLLACLFVMVVASCGGGSSVASSGGGVGSGGTGISSGTVTGFGSVVLDGTAYNSQTPLYYADSSQSPTTLSDSTAVQLGAQLQIQFDTQGAPTNMAVMPALVGQVANLGSSSFTVNGVTVYTNANANAGPLTYYAGLKDVDDLTAGMSVEVHGALGLNANGMTYVQATLIKQLPSTNTITRISGVIANWTGTSGASSFTLGTTTVQLTTSGNALTSVSPSGTALSNGLWVNVWSNQSRSGSGAIVAGAVQVQTLAGVSGPVQLGGVVSQLSGTQFVVNGVTIDARATSLASTLQNLSLGSYVVVQGQSSGSSNVLVATSISSYASQPAQVSLKGTITGYVSASNFLVRGVLVDASAAQFVGGNISGLANGLYVQITGSVGTLLANQVTANSVTVLSTPPDGGTVTYRGTVSQLNASAGSFTLALQNPDNGPTTASVALSPRVAYSNGSASQLVNGASVQIEASKTATGLLAYTISFNNVQTGQTVNGLPVLGTDGLAYAVTSSSFVINGLTIQLNGVLPQGGTLVNGAQLNVAFMQSGGQNLAVTITVDR
jgi:hypothetical protein